MTSPIASRTLAATIHIPGTVTGLEYPLYSPNGALSYGGTPSYTSAPFGIIRGRITLDEGWAPYCQAEIEMFTPSPDDLELIDPRDHSRLTITLAQDWTYPLRTPQSRAFDLLVRERTIDHEAGRTTLQLESDEGKLIDSALVANTADDSFLGFSYSLRVIVNMVLATTVGTSLQPGDADASFDANLEALLWEPGVTAWNFLAPLVQQAGLRLFCDEQRRWYLVDTTYTVPGQINVATTTNLTRGRDTVSRYGDWYDSVVVAYRWTDAEGAPQVAYDSAGTPGTKTYRVEWERAYPGAGAAAAILNRAQGRGRTLDLEALLDFNATPGKSLLATLPNIPLQSGVVSRVEWAIDAEGADSMVIASRGLTDTPATAWVAQPDGYAWADVPEGMSWPEYETPED